MWAFKVAVPGLCLRDSQANKVLHLTGAARGQQLFNHSKKVGEAWQSETFSTS